MVKKIVLSFVAVVVVAIIGILCIAASKPDEFRATRSASIKAPPEKIYALISNLHSWQSWSPYEKKDPNMKRSFSGPESGVGSTYDWDGNDEVGTGRLKIVEAVDAKKVKMDLEFFKPFKGDNTAEFTLDPKGDTTDVTWSMYGPNPFMCKVMQVFIDVDAMCGKDFDEGLRNLKSATESK